MSKGSLGELIDYLLPGALDGEQPPPWPPDLFALVASVLQRSGAYTQAINNWPPETVGAQDCAPENWVSTIREIAAKWRESYGSEGHVKVPAAAIDLWKRLQMQKDLPLAEVRNNRAASEVLLNLCAIADEASTGAGIPFSAAGGDAFLEKATGRLTGGGASLCSEGILRSKLLVLPKLHTPQSGMTIRSLSHHLALCPAGEITPNWFELPSQPGAASRHDLNVLLVPWPQRIMPGEFESRSGGLENMPSSFGGFFTYCCKDRPSSLVEDVVSLMDRAANLIGRKIDLLVLPELSLTPEEYEQLQNAVGEQQASIIAGVGISSPNVTESGRNYVAVTVTAGAAGSYSYTQDKHHRWRLDRRQIVQYGIGAPLDPRYDWWEHISIDRRELNFVALSPWLTFCTLMCEDLSRPDPAGEIIRAVGPNLVVTLLMDGPQMISRWSGRYAAVLADDPGSSVLCLTSIGMAKLSRPVSGASRSRVIALWKDAKGISQEIELPVDAAGVVLSLTCDYQEEWTADGRGDDETTGYVVLSGVHAVRTLGHAAAGT